MVWTKDEPEVQAAICEGCRTPTDCRQYVTVDEATLAALKDGSLNAADGVPCTVLTLCDECGGHTGGK